MRIFKMKKIVLLSTLFPMLLLLMLFAVSCSSVPLEKQCSADSDCIKASCCHASDAINKLYGPDCGGQFCTAECVPGTLDCGQGEVRCVKGGCKVLMKE